MPQRTCSSHSSLQTSPRFGPIKPKRDFACPKCTAKPIVEADAGAAPGKLPSRGVACKKLAAVLVDFASLLGRAAAQEQIRDGEAGLVTRSGVQTDRPIGTMSASTASRATDAAE